MMETEAVQILQRSVSGHRQDERAPEDADVASLCRQDREAGRCDWLFGVAAGIGARLDGEG